MPVSHAQFGGQGQRDGRRVSDEVDGFRVELSSCIAVVTAPIMSLMPCEVEVLEMTVLVFIVEAVLSSLEVDIPTDGLVLEVSVLSSVCIKEAAIRWMYGDCE
jgi:hypothetical protein